MSCCAKLTNQDLSHYLNKKLRYRRGTARRAMSVEILSTAAQLYEKSHLKQLTVYANDFEGD